MSGEGSGGQRLSPYQAVIGSSLPGLHPRLQRYFSAIPDGHQGRGDGVWDRVGTPRRWLWPVLWILAKQGVAFPVWGRGIPFTVVNTPDSMSDEPSVGAERTFRFPRRDLTMVDSIRVESGCLTDRLGHHGRLTARLAPSIVDGKLTLRSTRLSFRIAGFEVPVPRVIAPMVALTERFDDVVGRQHVDLTLTMPLIGRIYEYSGHFDYRIVPQRSR